MEKISLMLLCRFFCPRLYLHLSTSQSFRDWTPTPSLPLLSSLSLSPSLLLIIFHPDAMLLMNSIKSSFVTVWKTHTDNGSIVCSDTLGKQSLDAFVCAPAS